MRTNIQIKKGKLYLRLLILVAVLFEIGFILNVMIKGNKDFPGAGLKSVLFITFFILTYKYAKKWMIYCVSIFLILYCIPIAIGGFNESDLFLFLTFLFYLTFSLFLLLSNDIRSYFQAVRKSEIPKDEDSNSEEEMVENDRGLPSIVERVISTFIDSMIILGIVYASFYLMPESISTIVKIIVLFVIFSYEPLFVWKSRTLGQILLALKVKKYNSGKELNLFDSYIRYILKLLLGWLSLISISMNNDNRAIHDLVSGAIMKRS